MASAEQKDNAERPKMRSAGYSSPSILDRRHRILKETRNMIADGGIANCNVDEISRRAGVAKRTIYNAFKSKERLIASAIYEYFEQYARQIVYTTQEETLDRVIERLVIVARRNLDIKNYTHSLITIYYAHDANPEIRQTIHDIAAESHTSLIRNLARKRQLQDWAEPEETIDNLTRIRYAITHAWTEGIISDEDFIPRLVRSFLSFLAGVTRGSARNQIIETLRNLDSLPIMSDSHTA